jgi:hypothetical protein
MQKHNMLQLQSNNILQKTQKAKYYYCKNPMA